MRGFPSDGTDWRLVRWNLSTDPEELGLESKSIPVPVYWTDQLGRFIESKLRVCPIVLIDPWVGKNTFSVLPDVYMLVFTVTSRWYFECVKCNSLIETDSEFTSETVFERGMLCDKCELYGLKKLRRWDSLNLTVVSGGLVQPAVWAGLLMIVAKVKNMVPRLLDGTF